MEVTMKDKILCCGGVPIPDDDPKLKDKKRKKMTIIGIDQKKERIVICTEKPLDGRPILFIGSSVYCKEERRYMNYLFLDRFFIKKESIIPMGNRGNVPTYLWVDPQETFIKNHRVGHILTYIEI